MKKLLIPIIVFAAFLILYIGISRLNDNNYLFLPVWDVEHYLSISLTGYDVHPCTPGVDGPLGAICGNPGWFPMWPLVVKLFRPLFGGSSKDAFNYLPQIFTLFGVILIFLFVDKKFGRRAAIISILAVLFNPAGFYWMTGFPYALMLLLIAGYLWLLYLKKNIYVHLGLFLIALALSLSYPTGFLFAVIPLIWYFFEYKTTRKKFNYWLKYLGYLIPFALGPLLLFTYFYIEFDDFWLQLHFQEKYHRTWAFPLWVMFKSLFTESLSLLQSGEGSPWAPWVWFKGLFSESLLSPENLTILWYGIALAVFRPYKIGRELWVLAFVLYLFSLSTGTTMSLYRHYLIIIPVYLMIGASDRPLWLKLGYVAVGLAAALFVLFPKFMEYRLM